MNRFTFASALLLFVSHTAFGQGPATPGVIVAQAQIKSFPLAVEALGNASANEAVEIHPEITARLTSIDFEEGQFVEAGDKLAELENVEPLAELASARAGLVDSQSQYRRSQELFKTNAVAESELQQLVSSSVVMTVPGLTRLPALTLRKPSRPENGALITVCSTWASAAATAARSASR